MHTVLIAGQGHCRRLDFFLILSRLFHIFLNKHALAQSSEEKER